MADRIFGVYIFGYANRRKPGAITKSGAASSLQRAREALNRSLGAAPSADEQELLDAWAAYEAYTSAQADARADKASRADAQKPIKDARKLAYAWERELRSMYRYVFEYTAELRGRVNPATSSNWTRAERTAEALRLLPQASCALMVGQLTHPALVLIAAVDLHARRNDLVSNHRRRLP